MNGSNGVEKVLTALWFLLAILYLWPGGALMQDLDFEVFGWPFFVLWVVIIGPLLAILIYMISSFRYRENE